METIACLRRRDGHLNTRGLEITHFTVVCLFAKLLSGVRLMLTYFSNANYFVIMLIRFWSLSQRGHFGYSLTQKDLATNGTQWRDNWLDASFSCHNNYNGPGESKEYPGLQVRR